MAEGQYEAFVIGQGEGIDVFGRFSLVLPFGQTQYDKLNTIKLAKPIMPELLQSSELPLTVGQYVILYFFLVFSLHKVILIDVFFEFLEDQVLLESCDISPLEDLVHDHHES